MEVLRVLPSERLHGRARRPRRAQMVRRPLGCWPGLSRSPPCCHPRPLSLADYLWGRRGQSTQFGAALDMVTDRCATCCLVRARLRLCPVRRGHRTSLTAALFRASPDGWAGCDVPDVLLPPTTADRARYRQPLAPDDRYPYHRVRQVCLAPHSSLALALRCLTRVLVVSHKSIDLSKNIFLYYYYTSRPCLFFVCAANECVPRCSHATVPVELPSR